MQRWKRCPAHGRYSPNLTAREGLLVSTSDPSRATSTSSAHVVLRLDDDALERLAALVVQRLVPTLEAPATDDGWLDAKGAAAYLGFESVHPLHKLTARREVAFSQDSTGGKCWFRVADLDAYRLRGRVDARNG